ncbi:hypothetical protein CGLO_11602 [Colletotrichum gloeosporioides Cg-14]|jgi:amidase
MLRY